MDGTELCFMSATELAGMIATRQVSPVEVATAVLDRIEALEPKLNAMLTVTAELALDEAGRAEAAVLAGRTLGPLHGVPLTVKDLLNTAGVRTTFGSHAFADNVPRTDCVAVGRLRRAGAVLIGKTTTPEFGHKPFTEAPLFGRTLNPWDASRTAGGSSGGAGAAAAAGYGPLHVGTDGGGSIRIPAACCGVVGMKATLDLVPHDQAPDGFANLANVGPMTRTIADTALMLEVMAGPDPADPHSLGRAKPDLVAAARPEGDLAGIRIGWRSRLGNEAVEPETERLFEAAVATFGALGARLEPHQGAFTNTLAVWAPLTFAGWAARFGGHAEALGNRMSESLRRWIDEGRGFSAVEAQRAMALRTTVFRQVQGWFEVDDLVIMPTLSRPALPAEHDPFEPIEIEGRPVGEIRDAWYPYTHPFNLTGHPAITIPAGWTEAGLPVGLQIVGPGLGDARVLGAAARFEAARPWAERRPPLD
jgi:aspartyl-tRNA(Asn)/glutamyl-tRNA(Gln) amidotransferase subunit A